MILIRIATYLVIALSHVLDFIFRLTQFFDEQRVIFMIMGLTEERRQAHHEGSEMSRVRRRLHVQEPPLVEALLI